MLTYENTTIGTMEVEWNGENHRIEIRQGNCLAVFIHVYEDKESGRFCHNLYAFFVDSQHIRNILKGGHKLFGSDKVSSIRLNTFFKETETLLKYITKSGYEATCYYEETARETSWSWQK